MKKWSPFILTNKISLQIKDKLEGIDIDTEYVLIQKKQSRLSRMMRDAVVRRYEVKHGAEK